MRGIVLTILRAKIGSHMDKYSTESDEFPDDCRTHKSRRKLFPHQAIHNVVIVVLIQHNRRQPKHHCMRYNEGQSFCIHRAEHFMKLIGINNQQDVIHVNKN